MGFLQFRVDVSFRGDSLALMRYCPSSHTRMRRRMEIKELIVQCFLFNAVLIEAKKTIYSFR